MKTLAAYSTAEEAYLVVSLLEGSGIAAQTVDDHTIGNYWFYSHAMGGVKVTVAEDDFERALELLNLPIAEEGILACPHCGSGDVKMRPLSVLAAISLFLGFILPAPSRRADCNDCSKTFLINARKR